MINIKIFSYLIKGMDCAGCANKIEIFCNKIKGVQKAEVDFTNALLIVHINEGSNANLKLEKGIQSIGFQLIKSESLEIKKEENKTCCHNTNKEENSLDIIEHTHNNQKFSHPFTPKNNTLFSRFKILQNNIWFPIVILCIGFVFSILIESFSEKYGMTAYIILTLLGLFPVARKAFVMAKVGYLFSVETLMTISAVGAIAIGAAEEAAAVIILFMIGETIEGYTARRARSGIQALASLLPADALRIDNNGEKKNIQIHEIIPGDLIEVKPGSRIPIDGLIHSGSSFIDESLLTGESLPTNKKVKDSVVAGSISTDGYLIIQATRQGGDNTIQRMIKMVEEAQGSKSRSMRSIEKFSRVYTPLILLIGVLVAVIPPLIFSYPWIEWIYRGLTILLIGCPCALVISTPSAISSGITAASKLGILIKNAGALELIGKVTTVAFDKTGTLTNGFLKVQTVHSFIHDENYILQIAATVEEKSTHPLAKAILAYAQDKNIKTLEATNGKTLPGIGASALVYDKEILICSPTYAKENALLSHEQILLIQKSQSEGKTVATVIQEKNAIGFISLTDELKPDAKSSLAKLKKMGVKSIILTGDHAISANAIAAGLDAEISAELLPKDKLSHIQSIAKTEKIAMVGDGINDAPAIAAADIGIAMGKGTDVAVDTAQIIIARNSIKSIVETIELSRKTMNNIKQNISISIGLKAIFLFLTIVGGTQIWMAILADTGATVIVTLNAIRLLRYKGIKNQ
ncbi:heavy metal translocating P-type ATPase [Fluviispira sanaruensis]|uniref:P-type Zn(2+) transporter n=1 Tax=Fluviispira sanaruensis TaxID=2493639 RepID=A0A4P2VSU3_FLUSA|nr:heavy metal translocating P-type ATPase [Fluviispira sanaruensis]BBH52385.1 heavy metal translocating P-type ATPase [Fluviispira sanaruensis]